MLKTNNFGLMLIAAIALGAKLASATIIAPGTPNAPVNGEWKPIGGTVIAGGTTVPIISLNYPDFGFTGTLTTSVISGDITNPYGGLTFTYLITNDAGSISDIDRITINGFAGVLTDISYDLSSSGIDPSGLSRSSGFGTTVGFVFHSPPVSPDTASALLVIQTNVLQYYNNVFQVIDGDIAQGMTYAATPLGSGNPLPEPTTLAVAGMGITSLLIRRRRKWA